MGLRMKNFNVLGVRWKIRLLGGGFTKNKNRGGYYLKKGGAWTVCQGGEGLARKGGGVFEGGLIPQCTL